MSIKEKLGITLTLVIAFYAVINCFIFNHLIYPEFNALEKQSAAADLLRVEEAIKSELEHLGTTSQALAYSDGAYRFTQTDDKVTIEAGPEIDSLLNLNLNAILFYNATGNLVWGKVIDLTSKEVLPPATLFAQPLASDSDLLRHAPQYPEQRGSTGLIPTRYGPMLISKLAIFTSTGSRLSAGTMIIGRFLNTAVLEAYRLHTKVNFQLTALGDDAKSAGTRADGAVSATSGERFVFHETPQALHASSVLSDIYGAPYLLLRTSTPRDITSTGSRALRAALLALLVAGLISLSVIWLLLRKFIIAPLTQLKNRILTVRAQGVEGAVASAATSGLQRRDEIGVLCNEFDDMVRTLTSAQRQLADQSFKAGMAETTTAILHKLRNALVPLTHQIDEMNTACLEVPGARLEQAIDQLASPDVPAERRAKLVDYAKLTSRQLIGMRAEIADQLSTTSQQIDCIEAILSEQERLVEAVPEDCSKKNRPGLYWCADTIVSTDETLQASSDGHGHGAQFSVLLPAAETS